MIAREKNAEMYNSFFISNMKLDRGMEPTMACARKTITVCMISYRVPRSRAMFP